MPAIKVVLVHPQSEGNVGAVARAMMNFGLRELILVDPECRVGVEARRRAMHASEVVLDRAKIYKRLGSALSGADMVVGTTGVKTKNAKKFGRIALTPREFVEKIRGFDGTVAILFGQEDFGLDKETISRCDMLVTIPASEEYPIMNVSHAASVIFYELFQAGAQVWKSGRAERLEIGLLVKQFESLLSAIDYPEHKRKKTTIMFRRMLGRAVPSKWEYHTTMGVLKDAIRKAKKRRE
ncbi:MAG: RNA methyltransferase [Thermoplasmata archaeon]